MATFDYATLKTDTVIPLLTKFGATFSIKRTEDTSLWVKSYSPTLMQTIWTNQDTLEVVTTQPIATEITYSATGVLSDYEDSVIDGTIIKRNDKKLLTADISVIPQINDIFVVNSIEYKYVDHVTISPANIDVLYTIQLRI